MYSIGQVIYVLLAKNNQVYPMQVVEIITKKTLRGEDVRYLLQGGNDKASTVMLDQLSGEVFDTSDAARKSLVDRSTRHIDKLIRNAVTKAREWYGEAPVVRQETRSIEDLPPLAPRSSPGHTVDPRPLEAEETDGPAEDLEAQDEHSYVTLPDGTVAKIKLPRIT